MGHWKGGAGEREVIAKLTPWWKNYEPDQEFLRTPGSGGWAKKRNVPPGFRGHGDIMGTKLDSRFPFSIEVKWRKNVTLKSIQNFQEGKDSPVWGFWDTCVSDAVRNDLKPMLWVRGANVKGKRMEWRVVVSSMMGRAVLLLMTENEFLETDPMAWF